MSEELYREILIDHYKQPRGFETLQDDEVSAEGDNPNCGDHIRLKVDREDNTINGVTFDGKGCAICMASASMMTEKMHHIELSEATSFSDDFIAFMRGEKDLDDEELGDLVALQGVRQYPMRVKCATLSWHALRKALS